MNSLTNTVNIDIKNKLFIKIISKYEYIKISKIIFIEDILKNNFDNTILNIKYDLNQKKIYYPYISNLKAIKITNINNDTKLIKSVSNLIKKIQSIKINNSKFTFDYKKFLLFFYNKIKDVLNVNENEAILNYLNNKIILIKTKHNVIAHQDLHIGNIVYNKEKILIIDWDYAYINNKYFDVASFISESLYDKPKHILYFLKEFKYKKKDINMLKKIIEYQNILWFCWAKYMFLETKNNIYKEIYTLKWRLYINNIIEDIIN